MLLTEVTGSRGEAGPVAQEIQEGLSSGPATVWDREEIKRKGRAKKAAKTRTAKA